MQFLRRVLVVLIGFACSAAAWAVEVKMAFGEKIPPYCFPETHSGIELEVIGAALAHRGHVLRPQYFPLARVPQAFRDKLVDAAMTDLGQDLTPYGAHYGTPAVVYDNVLLTLKERNLTLRKPADLDKLTLLSFQGAINRYPEWLGPVRDGGRYFEQFNQSLQVMTLEKGRYDVVLSDRYIYRYHARQIELELGHPLKPVQEHRFVELDPADYRPVFRDPKVRDDFNAGLKHLKDSGQFQAIYDKYLKR